MKIIKTEAIITKNGDGSVIATRLLGDKHLCREIANELLTMAQREADVSDIDDGVSFTVPLPEVPFEDNMMMSTVEVTTLGTVESNEGAGMKYPGTGTTDSILFEKDRITTKGTITLQ